MTYEQLQLERQLCFRLYTASRLTTQTYEPFLKQLGITYTQYLVLLVLWEKDDQPINDIGKTLLLGINTISPLIKRMESQGLVARHNSDTDKRQQLVYLTQKGKEMKEKAAKKTTRTRRSKKTAESAKEAAVVEATKSSEPSEIEAPKEDNTPSEANN